jgi:hypothetical protein
MMNHHLAWIVSGKVMGILFHVNVSRRAVALAKFPWLMLVLPATILYLNRSHLFSVPADTNNLSRSKLNVLSEKLHSGEGATGCQK